MKRYAVVVTSWVVEYEKQLPVVKQAEVIVGNFDDCFYAKMFADAHNKRFKSDAHVVEYNE